VFVLVSSLRGNLSVRLNLLVSLALAAMVVLPLAEALLRRTLHKEAFDICLAHLGGYLFFAATFQTVGPGGKTVLGDDDNFFWIPLHLIGRLDIVGDALHFRLLDDGWLQDELKSGRLHLTCSQR
jgi:hypothetical protein